MERIVVRYGRVLAVEALLAVFCDCELWVEWYLKRRFVKCSVICDRTGLSNIPSFGISNIATNIFHLGI